MPLQFKRASKTQSRLRAAFFGPSGAGKTYSALRIASGMGGPIAVIDTERGSASKYATLCDFDVLDLPKHDIETYCEAIKAAADAGYNVLIIDSLSHAWQDLLQEVDKLARASFGNNTWAAWSKGTPKQMKLINTILSYPGHIIATMRSETVWEAGKDERGKSTYTRVGLAPKQGKGIEYEFDLLVQLTTEHTAEVIKDRTGKFQDTIIDRPGKEFGQQLIAWLSEGAEILSTKEDPKHVAMMDRIRELWYEGVDLGETYPDDAHTTAVKAMDMPALMEYGKKLRQRVDELRAKAQPQTVETPTSELEKEESAL